jgi:hypothetical protein
VAGRRPGERLEPQPAEETEAVTPRWIGMHRRGMTIARRKRAVAEEAGRQCARSSDPVNECQAWWKFGNPYALGSKKNGSLGTLHVNADSSCALVAAVSNLTSLRAEQET